VCAHFKLIVIFIIGLSLVLICASCTKKTTKPTPAEYWLFAGVELSDGKNAIFVIDAESDSVIDSVSYSGTPGVLDASPDGKYLGVFGGTPNTRIYEPNNLSVLHEFEYREDLAFVPQLDLILGRGTKGLHY